jgi:hypothetical protein
MSTSIVPLWKEEAAYFFDHFLHHFFTDEDA